MAGEGLSVRTATRVLGISESGYFTWRVRTPSSRSFRHAWLTELITAVHAASKGTYGYRRIHDDLNGKYGIAVSHGTVELLMRRAGLQGRSGDKRPGPADAEPVVADPIHEVTGRRPDQLWVTDVVVLPTPQGEVFCAVVLDTYSRRLMGWSMGDTPSATVVTDALKMAVVHHASRPAPSSGLAQGAESARFTSWAFTERAHAHGLAPQAGLIGDWYDHAVIGAFWGRTYTQLLDRRKWRGRLDLMNALSEYFEAFGVSEKGTGS